MSDDIDLSGQSPISTTTREKTQRELDPDILLRRDKHDSMERRGMRLILSSTVLVFAVLFLWKGLCFALTVGTELLEAKSSMISVLANPHRASCVSPFECSVASKATKITQPDNSVVSHDIDSYNNNWLSASSLIAIIAFILGVGLTLLLTLLKAAFQHPTDKDFNSRDNPNTIELATPISELISTIINYLKSKFFK